MNINGTKNRNEIMKDGAMDPLRPKHTICRLCRHPKIGSDQVRPNYGLRGCKCDELSPYHKPTTNSLGPLNANLNSHDLVFPCSKELHDASEHREKKTSENVNSSEKYEEPLLIKERNFLPPQGMDTGEYPRALFYQYYPNRNESYTFDLLPLPFTERFKYQGMRALSMDNEDVQEKWKDFLYNLPNSEFQSTIYPDDRFWRWRKYLRYKPDEDRNEFRCKMQAGPKYDSVGRLPITGEDLHTFRETKTEPKTKSKSFLKRGEGAMRYRNKN